MINPVARSILWQHGQPAAVKDSEDTVDDIAKSVTSNMGCERKDLKTPTGLLWSLLMRSNFELLMQKNIFAFSFYKIFFYSEDAADNLAKYVYCF